jgi:hypothetical protein
VGTNAVATGSPIASSDSIAGTSVGTAPGEMTFTFPTGTTLQANTNYVVMFVLESSTNGMIMYYAYTASNVHTGNYVEYNGSTWSANSGRDTDFGVYGDTVDYITASAGISLLSPDPASQGGFVASATISLSSSVATEDTPIESAPYAVVSMGNPAHPYHRWRYEGHISFTNPPTVNDYQVKLIIQHQLGMNADFSDIRFADLYGNAISYWIESKTDNSSAIVWVKVPNQDKEINFYYGNGIAVSESSIDATMVFGDDWKNQSTLNLDKWTASSTYTVGDGVIYPSLNTYIRSNNTYNVKTNIVCAKVRSSNYTIQGHMAGIASAPNIGSTGNYQSMFRFYSGVANLGNILEGTAASFAPIPNVINNNNFYIFRLWKSGTNTNNIVAVDSAGNTGSTNLSTYSTTASDNYLFLRSHSALVYTEYIFVRKYLATEPTPVITYSCSNPHRQKIIHIPADIAVPDSITASADISLTPDLSGYAHPTTTASSSISLAATTSLKDSLPAGASLSLAGTSLGRDTTNVTGSLALAGNLTGYNLIGMTVNSSLSLGASSSKVDLLHASAGISLSADYLSDNTLSSSASLSLTPTVALKDSLAATSSVSHSASVSIADSLQVGASLSHSATTTRKDSLSASAAISGTPAVTRTDTTGCAGSISLQCDVDVPGASTVEASTSLSLSASVFCSDTTSVSTSITATPDVYRKDITSVAGSITLTQTCSLVSGIPSSATLALSPEVSISGSTSASAAISLSCGVTTLDSVSISGSLSHTAAVATSSTIYPISAGMSFSATAEAVDTVKLDYIAADASISLSSVSSLQDRMGISCSIGLSVNIDSGSGDGIVKFSTTMSLIPGISLKDIKLKNSPRATSITMSRRTETSFWLIRPRETT